MLVQRNENKLRGCEIIWPILGFIILLGQCKADLGVNGLDSTSSQWLQGYNDSRVDAFSRSVLTMLAAASLMNYIAAVVGYDATAKSHGR